MERVWRDQFPVGHGGFHAGRARSTSGEDVHWVYDCGSRSSRTLNRELRAWASRTPREIDWLFISHFDADHVSGLEELFRLKDIRSVMLPYLNEEDLAYALCEAVLERAPAFLSSLIGDPVAWLGARGVRRIYFLGGAGDGFPLGTEDGPRPPEDGGGSEGWTEKISPPPLVLSPGSPVTPELSVIPGGEATVGMSERAITLRFEAYRAPVDPWPHAFLLSRLHDIARPFMSTLGSPHSLAMAVARAARDRTARKAVQSAYALGIGSSNRASLSLMSTIDVRAPAVIRHTILRGGKRASNRWNNPAWFSTGDAELLDPDDLDHWATRYRRDLSEAALLSLPHHGSDHNSDGAFQRLNRDALLTAQVKKGAKKHPGSLSKTTAGPRLALVTHEQSSHIRMISSVYP